MLEGPAGIGSGPVLPRDQTLVCSFNVLILLYETFFFFIDCFLYLFFSSPEYSKHECDRSAAVDPLVTRRARAAPHGLRAARAARGEALVGAGIACLCASCELRGCILGSALSPSVTEGLSSRPQFNLIHLKQKKKIPAGRTIGPGLGVALLLDTPIFLFRTKTSSSVGSQCSVNA